ncbi:MAG: alpha/beta fold hydrolase, partial [Halioglobus sp.]|nr:alpha/beta fold hydrolase [Halioglobus sp.]
MLKIIKIVLLVLLALLALAAIALHFSARAALDKDYSYTTAANQLPWFAPDADDGVVRLRHGEFVFRTRIAGFTRNPAGPLVLLLHGFPTTSAMYADLIPQLAAAGYRVLAPDQRGYSPGARPAGPDSYRVDLLAKDMFDFATTVGAERFHLVGHDWGAVVGWQMVLTDPGRVVSWSALSIPHPAAFSEALREDPQQRRSSSYFLLFATPWLAESLFAMSDMAALRGMLAPMSDTQMTEYLAMLREPGALTAAFNWYRATMT